ncbi:NAD-dependent epimerase/dehydratase family protein [Nocardia fluminea]|uniref:NAD-dependent epimerase/dehydratase family protein n=1 Tax=Nocardia fluminea TaxID=134984 RepID=UPI003D0DDDA8
MTTTLVTGGAGYLGGRLVPALRASGRNVVVVDPGWFGPPPWQPGPMLDIIRRDSRDLTIGDLDGVEEIIDLAGVSSESAATRLPALTWAVNDGARHRLAELARRAGVRRYTLPSSSNVYGASDLPVDEDVEPNPQSVYSSANRAAERHVLAFADDRFCPVVLRQATVYGWSPHVRHDLVVNAMTAHLLATGRCRVLGDGSQRRPLIWIGDLITIHLRLLATPAHRVRGQVFNAGAPNEQCSIGQLPAMISAALDLTPELTYYGDHDPMSHVLSYSKLAAQVGVEVGPSLERGVVELAHRLRHAPAALEHDRVRRSRWLADQEASGTTGSLSSVVEEHR